MPNEALRKQIESVADDIGVPRTSVLKWRTRGIPGHWQMQIVVASGGLITADMLLPFSSIRAAGTRAVGEALAVAS